MSMWWAGLTPLNQAFFVLAAFFSVLFAWQFVAALGSVTDGGHLGDGHAGDAHAGDLHAGDAHAGDMHAGDVHADTHLGGDHDAVHVGDDHSAYHGTDQNGDHDTAHDSYSLATFRLLSVRSILAFCVLFTWAGALYLQRSPLAGLAIARAVLWGLAGMVVVACFFWMLPLLTEEGTANLDTATGRTGQVYLNIPEDGVGQIKIIVGGALQFVRARSRNGHYLPAGTLVRVVRRLDSSTLEVEEVES